MSARQRLHVLASTVALGLCPRTWRCSAWLDSGYMFFVGSGGCGVFPHIFYVLVNSCPVVLFSRSPVQGLALAAWRSAHRRCFSSLFARAVRTRFLDTLATSSLLSGGTFLSLRRMEKYAQSMIQCLCTRCTHGNWTLFPRAPHSLQSLLVLVWVLAFWHTQPVFGVLTSVGVAR